MAENDSDAVPMSTPSPQEILVYIMVAASAADGTMSDPELKSIGVEVQSLPVFRDMDDDAFMKAVRDCSALLDDDDGLDTILQLAASLPARLQETAYVLVVDVAAADLSVAQEEVRFLQLVRDALSLDRLTTAAIERSAKARFQTS